MSQKKAFLIIILCLFGSLLIAQTNPLVFTEIMFRPTYANSEFIELFNLSNTSAVDLTGYSIKYYTSSADKIIAQNDSIIIKPRQYAVIFEGDYDFENGIYNSLIPPDALILKIDNNAFGTSGMANSSDRNIMLIDPYNDTLTAVTYIADNAEGESEEKILLSEDNSNFNWANSLVSNGTPGSKNSVAAKEKDLELSAFYITPLYPTIVDEITFDIIVKNNGGEISGEFSLKLFDDLNQNSTADNGEQIHSWNNGHLAKGDSIKFEYSISDLIEGKHIYISRIEYTGDEFINNNSKLLEIEVGPTPLEFNSIVINEIMFAPVDDEPEWIEIYNKSEKTINLKGFTISDKSSSSVFSKNDIYIDSGNYIVLAGDESFSGYYENDCRYVVIDLPSLNNSGDSLCISDSLKRAIDIVEYLGEWGKSGSSLERVSADVNSEEAENWKASLNDEGATPGEINSVTQKDNDVKVVEMFSIPKNPVVADNIKIGAVIKNIGKYKSEYKLILCEIEDTIMPPVELEMSDLIYTEAGDSLTYIFNYEKTNLTQRKIFYISADCSTDQDTSNNNLTFELLPGYHPNSIIINEFLFLPADGEPEWIELYNTSDYSIDVQNWSIGDVLTNPVFSIVTEESTILEPGNYLVVSKNGYLNYYHTIIPSGMIEVSFANLNNDSDGIVLKDNREITIDSLFYTNEWKTEKGKSLEKILYLSDPNQRNNWGISQDIELSTPGRINSTAPKKIDPGIVNISCVPEFPLPGDNVLISANITNYGNETAENITVQFFKGINTPLNLHESYNLATLSEHDSVTITSSIPFIISDTVKVGIRLNTANDEDPFNNYLQKIIAAGYGSRSLIVNEVMFSPESESPQWIEVKNIADSSLNLRGWTILSKSVKTPAVITDQDYYIHPGDFLVITQLNSADKFEFENVLETNFPLLSSKSGFVKIKDFRDALIDSIFYVQDNTVPSGISLEKLQKDDKDIWNYCLNSYGSSPGKENSLYNIPGMNFGDAIFTEIMYEPSALNSEFIELYNSSGTQINAGGWQVLIENKESHVISHLSFTIEPNEYFVIAADSVIYKNYEWTGSIKNIKILNKSSLGLTNTMGKLFLRDLRGNTIDSMEYSAGLHNRTFLDTKNISLEKINLELPSTDYNNWSSSVSVAGATPLKRNSISIENMKSHSNIFISPNPFSPDNDGNEDFTSIHYSLSQPLSQIRVKIFDSVGRLVRTLVNNYPSGAEGDIIYDGRDDNGRALRIGIYIVYIEAINSGGYTENLKGVVVIARKF